MAAVVLNVLPPLNEPSAANTSAAPPPASIATVPALALLSEFVTDRSAGGGGGATTVTVAVPARDVTVSTARTLSVPVPVAGAVYRPLFGSTVPPAAPPSTDQTNDGWVAIGLPYWS